jgi:hypothetical protein
MTETFEKGKTYEFEVLCKMELSSGKKFYSLKRGDRESYRVPLFPFQEISPTPKSINCLVKDINVMNGLPILHQDRYSLYKELYADDGFYIFTCMSDKVEIDHNGASFLQLEDEYGFRHKYYFGPHETPEVTDYLGLKIKHISEKGIIHFHYREQKMTETALSEERAVEEKESIDVLEDQHNEFKSSIAFPAGKIVSDIREQLEVIAKTITGFMNGEGGTLYIGVNDRGHITGINQDFSELNSDPGTDFEYKLNTDGYELRVRDAVKKLIGNFANGKLKIKFFKTESNLIYTIVEVPAIHRPVFVKGTLLYQRAGNTTQLLKGDDITKFIEERLLDKRIETAPKKAEKPVLDENSTELKENEEVKPELLPVLPMSDLEENRKAWTYFSFYKDGSWSFQSKSKADDPDFYKEILLYADDKDKHLLMCYDNGHMNVIVPKKVKSKKDSGKKYKNGWNQEAEIIKLFAANPYDLIAAFSKDLSSGLDMIKLHEVAHFNPVASIQSKGLTIINNKLGQVFEYKLVDVAYRQGLSGLIEPKAKTSSSLGIPLKSINHKAEIQFLNSL